jgi:hypothetical protein
MFVVAQPEYGHASMLQGSVDSMEELVMRLRDGAPVLTDPWDPDLRHMRPYPRAVGWALTNMSQDRRPLWTEDERNLDVEVQEDGGIRLFATVSDWNEAPGGYRVISDPRLYGLVLRVVMLASAISAETRYLGNWRFGVRIVNMRGVMSRDALHDYARGSAAQYDADLYTHETASTTQEVAADPVAIVDRLLGRLNRALTGGSYQYPAPR